ncbi:MarR family transcriptional regulator [Aliiglaciecola sp. CAU 1673]|uniref:MarR family winged helix-turn-helix transcriptional regulator n=1 Tax=Aliiglaciecola sp. CAU 1673 TaxID=3032595 RepID=UPI0023D9D452|nr:MarR family transcriptional regulator [Aliiglaciecola sp. CAU 1673]MDF2179490.1 MarR family transcriptional regulator [Aliiglaciecola sp. CAU 1673]
MQALSAPIRLLMALSLAQTQLLKRVEGGLSLHGISFSEFLVMYRLSRAPELTLRRVELAQGVGLTASGVTRLLLPMEKNHLVEKQQNARDARVSLVKLTETGARVLEEALGSLTLGAEEALQDMAATEQTQLLDLLEKLLHASQPMGKLF